jgi:hypothetical protein
VRRLSFLVKDDALFDEIDKIEFKKYKGKFVAFHRRERAGRLFDFSEGRAKKYTFDFGQGEGGVVSTDRLLDVDKLLVAAFTKRIADVEPSGKAAGRLTGNAASRFAGRGGPAYRAGGEGRPGRY